MIAATILVRPRFPRISEDDALPIKTYFTDKRTLLFTAAMIIMDLGIYIPWVSGTVLAQNESTNFFLKNSFTLPHMRWQEAHPRDFHFTMLQY